MDNLENILKNNIILLNINNKKSSIPTKLQQDTKNIKNKDEFMEDLKELFNNYITNKTTMECINFLLLSKNTHNLMHGNNLIRRQHDIEELFNNIINKINKYYKYNIKRVKYNEIKNIKDIHYIINNIFNNNNLSLYYLFGCIHSKKLIKKKTNNTEIVNYDYTLNISNQIKFKKSIRFNDINHLIKEYNKTLQPEKWPINRNNNANIFRKTQQELPIIACGKYIIFTLVHEKVLFNNGILINDKQPITLNNITNDLVLNGKEYEFLGTAIHAGGAHGGHYYSYININNKIYEYNDTNVSEVKNINNKIKNETPRIIIYKYKDDDFYMNTLQNNEPIINFFKNNKNNINKLKTIINNNFIGSTNYGNNCYFNSLLALLMHIPEFVYLVLNYNNIYN